MRFIRLGINLMRSLSLCSAVTGDFRRSWRELVLTDIAYKVIAFIVLTPIVGILFRAFLARSGKTIISDQDVLFFFVSPLGWACFVMVGGIWLAIVALEQAALIGILCAAANGRRLGVLGALHFAAATARPVLLVTVRLVGLTLLTILPFLGLIGLIYVALLGQHDINFYLKEKPPVFWVAVGLAGVMVAILISILLRLVTIWFFALPIVLFEDVGVSSVLRASRDRSVGNRMVLLFWLLGWAVATLALSVAASSAVVFLARIFVPYAVGSLWLLATAIGVTLVTGAGVNLLVNLLSTIAFAIVLFNLYRDLGSQGSIDTSRLRIKTDENPDTFRITTSRLVLAGLVGMVVAAAAGILTIDSVQLKDRVEIIAHRGASAAAPENTIIAVKLAIEDGADWVEVDVQETADGEVVVFHDSDFMKLAGIDLKIWDSTESDLKIIDVGKWFSPKFEGERVPKLGEVLDECKGKIGVNIELKSYGRDEQLEQRVAEIVQKRRMGSDVAIMSLKIDAVEKMKSLCPDWKVGLLMSVFAGELAKLDVDFLAINASFASRELISKAHHLGREVYVWTVNDAPTMSAMMSRGIDGLITDEPALARSVLEQRSRLSTPERLLLELAGSLGVASEFGEP